MADPLQCDPADKAALEARNGVKQLDYIDATGRVYKSAEAAIKDAKKLV